MADKWPPPMDLQEGVHILRMTFAMRLAIAELSAALPDDARERVKGHMDEAMVHLNKVIESFDAKSSRGTK